MYNAPHVSCDGCWLSLRAFSSDRNENEWGHCRLDVAVDDGVLEVGVQLGIRTIPMMVD
jgi:hypothetical protein